MIQKVKNIINLLNCQLNIVMKILYKRDNIYDLILVLNYNMKPIIKNKGSAIFIHVAKRNYKKTAGCIALKKADLIYLVKKIEKKTKVNIN